MISAVQCRSARALLGWSVAKLASAASVSASAIDYFEAERRAPGPAVAGALRRAFEPVGIVFLPGEDVRLRLGALFEVDGDSARNLREAYVGKRRTKGGSSSAGWRSAG
jgi:transcriptional regulator with XRE-family HTH domain